MALQHTATTVAFSEDMAKEKEEKLWGIPDPWEWTSDDAKQKLPTKIIHFLPTTDFLQFFSQLKWQNLKQSS